MIQLILLILLPVLHAAVFEGTLSSTFGWGYMGKFCFDYNADGKVVGLVTIELTAQVLTPPSSLAYGIYDDEGDAWKSAYSGSESCPDRARGCIGGNYSTPFSFGSDGVSVTFVNVKESRRPRFWYLVLVNCNGGYQDIHFRVTFTNVLSSHWNKQFGVNEQGLNSLYLVYFFVYTIFVMTHLYGVRKLSRETAAYVHPLIKIFTFAVLFQYLSVFSELIHLGLFVNDGIGVPAMAKFSTVMEAFARIFFIFLLILLAKGWTISTDEIRHRWAVLITVFITTVIYFSLVVWQFVGVDPASTLYIYASIPGILIVTLNAVIGLWYFITIAFTWKAEDEPHKRRLYLKLWVLYTCWFSVLPVIVVVGLRLDPWWCEKIVATFSLSVTTIAFFIMGFFLWPSRAELYFKIKTPDVAKTESTLYSQL
jgi:hypothetical protein